MIYMYINKSLERIIQQDWEYLKEHIHGRLNLSRIHICLDHIEDRVINYIYLKDNTFYSLDENILKCPEWS